MRWIKHVIAILVSNLLSVFNSFIEQLSVSCCMRANIELHFYLLSTFVSYYVEETARYNGLGR